jgi:hypothetical protein
MVRRKGFGPLESRSKAGELPASKADRVSALVDRATRARAG